ncbi:MAG TPA: alkaline phosphatase family protein [Streptosporangiaceae bacterium]|nr:alkaline phosphatase family protein [Streptosporangiaceae bacterium]
MIRWRILARLRTVVFLCVAALGLAGLAMTGTASAQPPSPIKHIVVLYLENHSFDSLLGFWCDERPQRCPDGGMPVTVKLSNGAVVIPSSNEPDIVPLVDHSVASQNDAIDGGRMDGWWQINGCDPSTNYACVGGWTPNQQPNLTRLADNFAISDHTFSMSNSPSWGGHLYPVLSNMDGFTGDNPVPVGEAHQGPGWGCDSNKETNWVGPGGEQMVPSCIPDPAIGRPFGGAFEATPANFEQTLMDSLTAANLTWTIFGAPTARTPSGAVTPGYWWDICPSIAECLYTGQKANNLPSSQFVSQAKAGNLPNFSIVTPGGPDAAFSEHNGMSMTSGDNWLGQVANAVMSGPDWRSTALFITWDDCGCFYDQIPPGTNPDGTPQGPRVPLVIVSPYARQGYTDTTATTFVGILSFVEHTFGLRPLGTNDAQAYDFSNAFNFGGGGGGQHLLKPVQMVQRPLPKDAHHINLAQLRQDT